MLCFQLIGKCMEIHVELYYPNTYKSTIWVNSRKRFRMWINPSKLLNLVKQRPLCNCWLGRSYLVYVELLKLFLLDFQLIRKCMEICVELYYPNTYQSKQSIWVNSRKRFRMWINPSSNDKGCRLVVAKRWYFYDW